MSKATNVVTEDVDVGLRVLKKNYSHAWPCNSSTPPCPTSTITGIIVINIIIAKGTYWTEHIAGTILSDFMYIRSIKSWTLKDKYSY